MKRFFVTGLLLLSGVLQLLVGTSAHAESLIDEVLDRGKLRVGLSSFTPWAMRAKNGEMIGFEVDIARRVAADMDVELELVVVPWDGIITALAARKFDVIISGMYVTPKRALKVSFTDPYYFAEDELVANRQMTGAGFETLAAFNDPSVTFALRRGASPVEFVRNHLPEAQIVQFDDDASALQEVLNGRAHAWLSAAPQPSFAAIKYPEKLHQPVTGFGKKTPQAFALRKGDADTLTFFNNWIAIYTANGYIAERGRYWFKSKQWESDIE